VKRQLPNGSWVVRMDGDSIYLKEPELRPTATGRFSTASISIPVKYERLFRSDKTSFEQFLSFAGSDAQTFITWHQSPADPPNAFGRMLGKPIAAAAGEAAFASTSVAITHIPDPTPEVRAIKKRLVKYKRPRAGLVLPPSTPHPAITEDTRVPAILDAYPLDYAGRFESRPSFPARGNFHAPAELPAVAPRGLRHH